MTRKSKLSPEQTACLGARVAFKLIREEFIRLRAETIQVPKGDCTDEEISAIVTREMELEDRTGYTAARERKLQTELALVAWAEQHIKTNPLTCARFGQVADVFTKGMRNPIIREKLIEQCLRLAA